MLMNLHSQPITELINLIDLPLFYHQNLNSVLFMAFLQKEKAVCAFPYGISIIPLQKPS